MSMQWKEIGLAALVCVLLLWVEHWGPWQRMLKKTFHPTTNYILGVLAIIAPLGGLFLYWGEVMDLAAMAAVTCAGGLAVIGAYALDAWMNARDRRDVAEQEARSLRPEVKDDAGQDQ